MIHDIVRIEEIASGLRTAMEMADFADCPSNLANFPSHCCHHASSLLLIVFDECRINGFAMFRGQHPDWGQDRWHVWIQRGNTVVDITADQFGDQHQPVIVGGSPWHKELSAKKCRGDRVDTFDIPFYKSQTKVYDRIMATGALTCMSRRPAC